MYRLTIYAVRMICERSLSPVDHISLVIVTSHENLGHSRALARTTLSFPG